MLSKRKIRIGAIQIVATLALVGGVAGTALASRGPDRPVDRVAEVRSGDLRGNCDEAEHAADPACAGTTGVATTTAPTTPSSTVSDDGVGHDKNNDHGGLRPAGVRDDGPTHDLNDDHGSHGSDGQGGGNRGRG